MEEVVLNAKLRDVVGKQVKALRREGRLPAVLYGRHLIPILISLDMRDTSRVLPTITSSHLVVVDVDGEKHTTLVREKQRHPVTGGLLHVDFQVLSMTEKLRTTVVIVLEGEAPAAKNYNGVLVTGQTELEVECLPSDLPERVRVDVSGLTDIGNSIHVRDLVLPPKVEVLTDPDELVVLVTAPAAEEKEEVVAVEGAIEPEVIEKGKKEEEEEF
jgi:large subunit ribosomal protein L25